MTLPRQKLPDKVYFVTRRCVGREFLLHGAPVVQQIWEYLFAVACQREGLSPIGYMAMSNHVHYLVYDPKGRLPKLTSWLHAQVARAVNSFRGRSGTFWEREETSQPEVADGPKVLDKLGYTIANPVRAGLVPWAHQWPGARSCSGDYGRSRVIKRPETQYFERSKQPEQVDLQLEIPPTHRHMSPAEFGRLVDEAIAAHERAAHEELRAAGRGFAGIEAVRRIRWTQRAASPEARGRGRNFKPKVLASSRELREAVLDRISEFQRGYASALLELRAGHREVVFPAGTYRLVVDFGVRCHPPP